MGSSIFHVLLPLFLCFLLQKPTESKKQSYIVYLGSHSHGPNPSSADLESVTESHYNLLGSYVGSKSKAEEAIFYSYKRYINGFAAELEEEEAAELAKNPKVVSVFLNRGRKLHTTHSWDFLGFEQDGGIRKSSTWEKGRFGEDTIIGNLDTGVWPESKSFSDEGIGPIPPKWHGSCQFSESQSLCNRKLIGAKFFIKGYESSVGKANASLYTTRDHSGHGSHTLSTAGGSFVPGTSVFGSGNGTASGGSPKARVAAYKVCFPPVGGIECADADILAGFEAAISDGVDVLSVSLGSGPAEFSEDVAAIGSFHATANGILVVSSAGNSGPDPSSVCNLAPWMFTVAASTIDRKFNSFVTLGNNMTFQGESLSESQLPPKMFFPLMSAADAATSQTSIQDALLCKPETLDPLKVKGKILVCLRGDIGRTDKGMQAAVAGAVGMILVNDETSGNEIEADAHVLPASHVSYTDGQNIFAYINQTKSPVAFISGVTTELGIKPAPSMAPFSSRGPNAIEASILKPDITSPGVNIIAAYSGAVSPSETSYDLRRVPFNTMSGTSMSCPHVSGVAGLLKTLYPQWSPSAIKSAIMTTATTKDDTGGPLLELSKQEATPFAYGAGHIQPNNAVDPGLVYDLNTNDYLNFLCGHGYSASDIKLIYGKDYVCPKGFRLEDFNYPTIAVSGHVVGDSLTVTRTVTNVGSPGTYKVLITPPAGVEVSVEPNTMSFKQVGETQAYHVVLKINSKDANYVFGELDWFDGNHHVRSPIVVIHKMSYIVYLGSHSHGRNPSSADLESVTESHYNLLGSYVGSKSKAKESIFYSYNRYINGFAAELEEEEAIELAKNPKLVSIFLNKWRKLQTTHSWDFLGFEQNGGIRKSSTWEKGRFGEDTIIGNMDSGVWPESKSFSEEGIGPIPPKWHGSCQFGESQSLCNRKLIGARFFIKGYESHVGKVNASLYTTRDHSGHGSHTLSTAGGSFVPGTSVFGSGNGTASGGSPKARVAAYKVCFPPVGEIECVDADILAGFEAAIIDGVDVLSVSLGGSPVEFYEDVITIGSFHATANGILVVSSAGNYGPDPSTVCNLAPWMFTVAASTIDRKFNSFVTLGNNKTFEGESLSQSQLPPKMFFPLMSAADAKTSQTSMQDALLCKPETLDPLKVKGKILVCLRGDIGRTDKGMQAAVAGAVGMILANDETTGNEIEADAHVLPASHVSYGDGQNIFAYINQTKSPVAYISGVTTELGRKPAPSMAPFSSRGPSAVELSILKPDITAPGVNIIAAYSGAVSPSETSYDKRRVPFNTMSGTSMSCPHVSGVAGLLKTLYPQWSPSAIKSAIMTTATTKDDTGGPLLELSKQEATPFAYGAGHIQPNNVVDPGLVYDLNTNDYLNFLCGHGYSASDIKLIYGKDYVCPKGFRLEDFNYPTISVSGHVVGDSVTVTRTVTNVGSPGTYRALVTPPAGVEVSIEPNTLSFKQAGETQTYHVVLKINSKDANYVFGELDWFDGNHHVRSLIVVIHKMVTAN
ncbi:hypothetical protein L6164_005859 [Bauhinia variegata]|uniref:Uncharacterized protein n=1 Tax=Bauhinia variegata TaxID=167791 RepID=A0ACB9PS34_BAUVA|nr:hypothetical protein L6164_005859 [Bauhinia variegata]